MAELVVFLVDNVREISRKYIFSTYSTDTYKREALICTWDHIDSGLYDVVIKDNIDEFKRMDGSLKVGVQRTPTGNTVLHLACQYWSLRCAEHILSVHDSLLLKVNSRGETALHLAAREGHYDVIVALINTAKSSPNLKFKGTESVQELIRTANLELETALHAAVRYNHKDVVQLLVTEDPSHTHPINLNEETPLYLASIRGYSDVIRTILDNCESPTYGGPHGRTALHAAVLNDESKGYECMKLLLGKYQDLVDESDRCGWTVLHYVAYYNHHTIVEDLAAASNYIGYHRDRGHKRTALHVAAYKGNFLVMEKILRYFPDSWDIVDKRNRNILHIAVEQDKKEVIRFILSQGSEARNSLLIQSDVEGNTPLHLIAKLGCYVQELMDIRELDWEVLNNENLTPLDQSKDRQSL